jgi:hypothetical protein
MANNVTKCIAYMAVILFKFWSSLLNLKSGKTVKKEHFILGNMIYKNVVFLFTLKFLHRV